MLKIGETEEVGQLCPLVPGSGVFSKIILDLSTAVIGFHCEDQQNSVLLRV